MPYYVAHLEKSPNPIEPLLELLTEHWLKAWFISEGSFNGFLSDVERVFKTLQRKKEMTLIGEELRCLLFSATILSFTNNLRPGALVECFIDEGCWTLTQALQFAYQYSDERKHEFIQAIDTKIRFREQTEEVIRFIAKIHAEMIRIESLEAIVRHLKGDGQLLRQVVALLADVKSESAMLRGIKCVVPYVRGSETLLKQTIQVAKTIDHPRLREQASGLFVATLKPNTPLFADVFDLVNDIADDLCLRDGLSNLGTLIGDDGQALESILAAIARIGDVGRRVDVMVNIVPHLQKVEWIEGLKKKGVEISDVSYRRKVMDAIERHESSTAIEDNVLRESFDGSKEAPGDDLGRTAETRLPNESYSKTDMKDNRYRVIVVE